MSVFRNDDFDDHEAIHFICDEDAGLHAVIAIHDRSLGPALGGLRMFKYATEHDAVSDVLRLSRGMSFKNAIAGIPFGGGKAVILGDPTKDKSPELFGALGKAINNLGGAYITAEDVGTNVQDMDYIRSETEYARGTSKGVGDPSPHTARGVLLSIQEAVRSRTGTGDLKGLHVAVQGLGNVGANLVRLLSAEDAQLTFADIDEARTKALAQETGACVVEPDAILTVDADVLAPCAMGAVLTHETAATIRAGIICGAANNQLADPGVDRILADRDILYVPDFVANAGGVIDIALEGIATPSEIERRVDSIGLTVRQILQRSDNRYRPIEVAEALASERMSAARRNRNMAA